MTDDEKAQACADAFKPLADAAVKLLPGEGDEILVVKRNVRRCCEECGEFATKRLTFLYENYRRNPASNAYGKDDCSWCYDEELWSCHVHEQKIINHPPEGTVWCSSFDGERFPHMLLRWEVI